MLRCNIHIDQRQHGFMERKSFGTQLVCFCDSITFHSMKIYAQIYKIVYFEFVKQSVVLFVFHHVMVVPQVSLLHLGFPKVIFLANSICGVS